MYTGIRVVAMPNKTNVHINDLIKACMTTKWLNVSISFLFTTVFLHDHDFDLMVILLNLSFFRSAQWCWPKPKVKSLKLIGEVTMSDRNLSKNEWEGEKTIEIGEMNTTCSQREWRSRRDGRQWARNWSNSLSCEFKPICSNSNILFTCNELLYNVFFRSTTFQRILLLG